MQCTTPPRSRKGPRLQCLVSELWDWRALKPWPLQRHPGSSQLTPTRRKRLLQESGELLTSSTPRCVFNLKVYVLERHVSSDVLCNSEVGYTHGLDVELFCPLFGIHSIAFVGRFSPCYASCSVSFCRSSLSRCSPAGGAPWITTVSTHACMLLWLALSPIGSAQQKCTGARLQASQACRLLACFYFVGNSSLFCLPRSRCPAARTESHAGSYRTDSKGDCWDD